MSTGRNKYCGPPKIDFVAFDSVWLSDWIFTNEKLKKKSNATQSRFLPNRMNFCCCLFRRSNRMNNNENIHFYYFLSVACVIMITTATDEKHSAIHCTGSCVFFKYIFEKSVQFFNSPVSRSNRKCRSEMRKRRKLEPFVVVDDYHPNAHRVYLLCVYIYFDNASAEPIRMSAPNNGEIKFSFFFFLFLFVFPHSKSMFDGGGDA